MSMENAECRCCCDPIEEDDNSVTCAVCEHEVHYDCSQYIEGNESACQDCIDTGAADEYLDSLEDE